MTQKSYHWFFFFYLNQQGGGGLGLHQPVLVFLNGDNICTILNPTNNISW